MEFDKLRNCVTAPDVHPSFLTHTLTPQGCGAIRHTNDRDCKDAKPYKHIQHLTLRKENVIANIINSSADKNNAAV